MSQSTNDKTHTPTLVDIEGRWKEALGFTFDSESDEEFENADEANDDDKDGEDVDLNEGDDCMDELDELEEDTRTESILFLQIRRYTSF